MFQFAAFQFANPFRGQRGWLAFVPVCRVPATVELRVLPRVIFSKAYRRPPPCINSFMKVSAATIGFRPLRLGFGRYDWVSAATIEVSAATIGFRRVRFTLVFRIPYSYLGGVYWSKFDRGRTSPEAVSG